MSNHSKLSTYALLAVVSQWPLQSEELADTPEKKVEILNVEAKGSTESVQTKIPSEVKKAQAKGETQEPFSLRKSTNGFVSATYRARSNEHTDDHDLYTNLGLNVNEGGKASFNFLGRLATDLDGNRDSSGYYVYDSLADSTGHSMDEKIFSAHADLNKLGVVDALRLGRQTVEGTPEVAFFDGLSADSSSMGSMSLKAGVYGGVPVRFYESSSEDSLVGGHVQMEPTKTLKARLDWMRSTDDRITQTRHDDIFSVNVEKQVQKSTRLLAAYSMLENEARDVALRCYYRNMEKDLSMSFYLYTLIQTQNNFALEFDPFYSSTKELYPYYKASTLISKGLGDTLVLDTGYDLRRVKDSSNVGSYNREYDRFFVTPMLLDKPWVGGSCSVTLDLWKSGDRQIFAYGGDLSHKCTEKLDVSAGTLFSMYKYDLFSDSEKEDVQTYYLKAKYKMSKMLRFNSSYEYETDSLEANHVIKLGIVCLF